MIDLTCECVFVCVCLHFVCLSCILIRLACGQSCYYSNRTPMILSIGMNTPCMNKIAKSTNIDDSSSD